MPRIALPLSLLTTCLLLRRASTLGGGEQAPEGEEELTWLGCSQHLQSMDWNENVSDAVWAARTKRAVACLRSSQRLAREAGSGRAAAAGRPAAMSGLHVPTLIVPTESEELPELPPFYFVLPFWDMVVSNRVRLFGAYDHQELDVLLRLIDPGEAFVDVGANVGAVTVPLAAHVGRDGVVYAFEPFRQVFQYLNANVAANGLSNVHTFQTALSDDAGAGRTVRAPGPSLLAGQNAGMYAVFQGVSTEPNEQTSVVRERIEDVSVRTLDSFDLPRADLVKIDVEGHAARVLAGALKTLRRHRPVLWFEEGGPTPEALQLPDLGYWCTKLSETTEEQYICVPRERHAWVQERLNS